MTDSDQYTALLLRHKMLIWRLCRRYAKHDADHCSDLVQEVSLLLWQRFGRLQHGSGNLAEMRWVVTNTRWVLRNMHRGKRGKEQPLASGTIDLRDDSLHERDLVADLMSALPVEDRELMQMKLDGYTAAEIGKRLGLSRDTVYQRIHRIIIKLREINNE